MHRYRQQALVGLPALAALVDLLRLSDPEGRRGLHHLGGPVDLPVLAALWDLLRLPNLEDRQGRCLPRDPEDRLDLGDRRVRFRLQGPADLQDLRYPRGLVLLEVLEDR